MSTFTLLLRIPDREHDRSLSMFEMYRESYLRHWRYAMWLSAVQAWFSNIRNDWTDHPLYATAEGAD